MCRVLTCISHQPSTKSNQKTFLVMSDFVSLEFELENQIGAIKERQHFAFVYHLIILPLWHFPHARDAPIHSAPPSFPTTTFSFHPCRSNFANISVVPWPREIDVVHISVLLSRIRAYSTLFLQDATDVHFGTIVFGSISTRSVVWTIPVSQSIKFMWHLLRAMQYTPSHVQAENVGRQEETKWLHCTDG